MQLRGIGVLPAVDNRGAVLVCILYITVVHRSLQRLTFYWHICLLTDLIWKTLRITCAVIDATLLTCCFHYVAIMDIMLQF